MPVTTRARTVPPRTLANVFNIVSPYLTSNKLAVARRLSKPFRNLVNRDPSAVKRLDVARRRAKRRVERRVERLAETMQHTASAVPMQGVQFLQQRLKHKNIVRGKLIERAGINQNTRMVAGKFPATHYMEVIYRTARWLEDIRKMPKLNLNRNNNNSGNFSFSNGPIQYRLVRGTPGPPGINKNEKQLKIMRYGRNGLKTMTIGGVRLSNITTKGQRRALHKRILSRAI